MFEPKYTITNKIASYLMKIQEAQAIVDLLPLPASVLSELQRESKEQTVILSTRMEGNTLDELQARSAAYELKNSSDEQEVYNLMIALQTIEVWEAKNVPITEERIQELHAIIQVIQAGRRPKRSEYRTQQNQVGIRNQSGFYLPPEWTDVPQLMEDVVSWVNAREQFDMVVPIKAGILMYQLLTIHPDMDGNGRTARMLATYVMRTGGLALKGLFVLEKYYDRHLRDYYDNLQLGLHHNYYFGRNNADITKWLEFFVGGVAEVFQDTARIVKTRSLEYTSVEPMLIRKLDAEQRIVFGHLVFRQDVISRKELSVLLSMSDRTLRDRTQGWIQEGFLVPSNEHAQRIHSFTLAPEYREMARDVQAEPDRFKYLLIR